MKRQEVTIVITYPEEGTFLEPSQWDWQLAIDEATQSEGMYQVVLKGYGEPQDVD